MGSPKAEMNPCRSSSAAAAASAAALMEDSTTLRYACGSLLL
jgi:hypothetical protein